MQRCNVVLSRQNITLQFLNLVIEYEFELLKLLGLFLEFNNASVLVLNRCCSRLKFSLLSQDGVLVLNDSLVEDARCACLLLDLFGQGFFLSLSSLELALLHHKVPLVIHTVGNNLIELFLVAILKLINFEPGLILNLLSSRLVFLRELVHQLPLLVDLVVFLPLLQGVFLLHLSLRLVVLQEQLLNVLLKFDLLLLHGGDQRIRSLLVRSALLVILSLLHKFLFLVDLFQVFLLSLGFKIDLLLLHGQLSSGLLKESLLLINLLFKFPDLLVILGHRLLELLISSLLLQLNVSLQCLDLLLNRVQAGLFNQDFFAQMDAGLLGAFAFGARVQVLHTEAGECSIDAH